MGLHVSRSKLKLRLLGDEPFKPNQLTETMKLINEWWQAYKAWEAQDSFVAAFSEGRLAVRQGPEALMYGQYQGEKSFGDFAARHRDPKSTTAYPNERYRVGANSLKERMNPANFGMDQGEKLKYKRGLHDLSASLLAPSIPFIKDQLRWKWTGKKLDEWITIFMPLAQPEDMGLFAMLNTMAKEVKTAQAEPYKTVVYMRDRMTRLKLADSVDIGAGLQDVAVGDVTAPGYKPKLKYGVKGLPDQNGRLTGKDLERYNKTLFYTSILPRDGRTQNTNEIVIAFREHAGDRFPIFTRFDGESAFVCLEDEPSSRHIVGGKIPNAWAQTLELG
jgi:hypothetical protein